jgi:two-component system, OmpR family, phosphate regulon sensor histidine kinase PhoR
MQPRPVLLATTAIAAVPIAGLLVMAAAGLASPLASLALAGAVLIAALIVAVVWARDLALLAETARHAGEPTPPAHRRSPRLGSVEPIVRDIERLSRAMASHAALVGRLRQADEAVVERLPDPLIVLAADRSVRRANAAARAAFGADMLAVLRHPVLRGAVDRAFAQGTPQQAALTIPVPVPRELQATVVVMDPPLADGGRAMIVLSDRTRERAAERTRADFIANASHELRTPLASLIGFVETLRGPAADDRPAQQRFLAIMAEQAERMNRIIDDLLGLSRIELTEHRPPSESVDLATLVPRIAAGFEPRVAARRITLAVEIADGLPPVVADADQLAQVLHNLLDNAVKYGREAGTIRLSARVAVSDPRFHARPGVVLAVADDGAGIPREHLPRLTERFYRVDAGRSRAVGGTGLGLAIVKHIVNRHRGQLAIESEEGAGTTVSVWLPRAKSDAVGN